MESLTLHDVLLSAKKQGAADVHYVVGSPPIMHLNPDFVPIPGAQVTTAALAESIVSALLTPDDHTILQQKREAVGAYTFPDGLRCRYRIFYQKDVLSLSFHVLSETIPTLASLRLSDELQRFVPLGRGLVIITGPYGSGRSSTVTAILQEINRSRATSILTIESPI